MVLKNFHAAEDGNEYFSNNDGGEFPDYIENDHSKNSISPNKYGNLC